MINFLSGNIRTVRLRMGLTQREFAELMGTKRTTLANYEQGGNEPTLSFMERICDMTEIDLKSFKYNQINPDSDELMKAIIRNVSK